MIGLTLRSIRISKDTFEGWVRAPPPDEQSLTFDSDTIPEDDPELGQSRPRQL